MAIGSNKRTENSKRRILRTVGLATATLLAGVMPMIVVGCGGTNPPVPLTPGVNKPCSPQPTSTHNSFFSEYGMSYKTYSTPPGQPASKNAPKVKPRNLPRRGGS